MAQTVSFQRDLGYLAKFFDALRAHAATLDQASRERLLALLDAEQARWREITALLGGESQGSVVENQVAAPTPVARSAAPQLTVGSLLDV